VTPSGQAVGIIGLGRIGGRVGVAVAREGFTVSGYDVRPETLQGLSDAIAPKSTPREVAEDADVVLIAVLDDVQLRDVVTGKDGIVAAQSAPSHVVVLTTATLDTVRWAEQQVRAADTTLLDCGVSGGSDNLKTGRMTGMVGGDAEAFAAVLPVLAVFLDPVLHMGSLGKGMVAKLARNLLVYADWSTAWEAARLAQAAGVDIQKFVQAVEASDRLMNGHMTLVGEGVGLPGQDDEVRARARVYSTYAHKDLEAILELGAEFDVDLSAARLALSRMADVTSPRTT
jgi:3-hydroxyisobutyrate dehydrogenase-like beta-hydroxyacid dehydrogenase